jgi:chorismate mutase
MTAATAAAAQDVEPGDLDTFISDLRTQIDTLDDTVVRLLQERQLLSRRIQAARVAAGGVRVELSRERAVLDTYGRGLGAEGTSLATAVLRACRGRL